MTPLRDVVELSHAFSRFWLQAAHSRYFAPLWPVTPMFSRSRGGGGYAVKTDSAAARVLPSWAFVSFVVGSVFLCAGFWSGLRAGTSRTPDRSDLPGLASAAEELVAAIGLEPGNVDSGRHVERLKNFAGASIDVPQVALVTFPGRVPELAINPGHAGDEAVGIEGAKNRSGLGIDLMNLALPVLPHPEGPFGPRQPRVAAPARRRDDGEHAAALRINFLNAVFGDLKKVLAIERGSGMRGDIQRAQRLAGRRIEGVQLVSGGEPDVLTVVADAMHAVGAGEGTILTDDFSSCSFHCVDPSQWEVEPGVTKSS